MRRTVSRLTAAILGMGLAVIAAEYSARLVFHNAHSSGNSRDYVAVRGGGPSVVINKLGFREREIPPKDPQRYRIVVVGDSFTWGQGIEEYQRFSDRLEGLLGDGFEVFNFGRPGNNMPEHLQVLDEALRIAPDFILLQLYINDFETRQMVRPQPYPLLPASWRRSLERTSILYDLLDREWADWQQVLGIVDSYPRYMARNLRDPAAPNSRLAFGMLSDFIDRAHRAGVASGIVLFPAPDAMGPNGSHYPFGYLHERVKATCRSARIPCVDLLPTFSTIHDPHSMWVTPFDAHPNAMANQLAAKELLRELGPRWCARPGPSNPAILDDSIQRISNVSCRP